MWLDTARMVVRLIRAGHSAPQAQNWATALPTWARARPDAVDAFAAALATNSRRLRDARPDAPFLGELADAADAWLRHRTQRA